MRRTLLLGLVVCAIVGLGASLARGGDAPPQAPVLASWNDGATKSAILQFVHDVTTEGGAGFVPVAERIAVFDNDGTLWSEQPMYVQLAFALDRVKALAPEHPEWKTTEPFKSVLANDLLGLMAAGERGLLQIVMATHSGMTTEEFDRIVKDWTATAKHPKYGQLVHRVRLPAHARAPGVPAGERVQDVHRLGRRHRLHAAVDRGGLRRAPEQVVGSTGKLKFELRDGVPVLLRLPELDAIDDKAGKPIGIQRHIGRRPIAAFGNSDGDLEMLQWTTAGSGRRFGLLVHHTDGEREVAYDRKSFVGRLDKALDEAVAKGWTVVDMKKDWKKVFAFEK